MTCFIPNSHPLSVDFCLQRWEKWSTFQLKSSKLPFYPYMRNVRHMSATQRGSYPVPQMTRTSSWPAWLHFLLTDLHFPGKLERNAQRRGVWTVIWAMKQASGQNTVSWIFVTASFIQALSKKACALKINQAVQGRCMTRVKLNIRKSSAALRRINICFQIPSVKVSRHSFYLQMGNLQCKKGGRAAYTNPCINVRKDTTRSSHSLQFLWWIHYLKSREIEEWHW